MKNSDVPDELIPDGLVTLDDGSEVNVDSVEDLKEYAADQLNNQVSGTVTPEDIVVDVEKEVVDLSRQARKRLALESDE